MDNLSTVGRLAVGAVGVWATNGSDPDTNGVNVNMSTVAAPHLDALDGKFPLGVKKAPIPVLVLGDVYHNEPKIGYPNVIIQAG